MFNKKRIIVFFVFILLMFFMMTFAGEPVQNASIATRQVIFTDGFDGRDLAKFQVEVGEDAEVPEIPVHENHVFMGWYQFANQRVKVNTFTTILDDLHVIALYDLDLNNNGIGDSEDTYFNVNFVNSISNETLKTERVLIGMSATAPEVPTISNYTFGGWDKSYTNVRENLTVNTVYNSNPTNPSNPDNPRPRINTYTVTFIDGDDNSVIDRVTVNEGLSASTPVPPTHEKRLFVRWSGTYTNVRSDQTVIAIYGDNKNNNDELDENETKYTVKFESNGRGHLESKNDIYEFNGLLKGLSFEENGVIIPEIVPDKYYKSLGWKLNDESVQISSETEVSDNVTYIVTFGPINDNNGDNNKPDGKADEEQLYTLIVNYVFEADNSEAHVPYIESRTYYDENERYNLNYYIVSPTIKGYTPDKLILEGKIDSDNGLRKEITVKYRLNRYTITWNNYDGSLLEEDYGVEYGTKPSYDSEEPTKVGNSEYSYVFVGWTPELKVVSSNITYTAKFNEVKNKYVVKFVDADGTELQSSEVEYGETPEYNGETPTKASNAQYTYSYVGWDKEITPVTEDVTYTATYTSTTNTYTITWVDADGTELEKDENVEYGETPEYNGETPIKVSNAQYTYTFAGWTPELASVTENVTYTATYEKTIRKYNIEINTNCEEGEECEIVPNSESDEELPEEAVEYGTKVTLPNINREHTLKFSENGTIDKNKTIEKKAELLGYCKNTESCTEMKKPGEEVEIDEASKYNAVWKMESLEITSLPVGEGYQTETNVYTFKGWSESENGREVSLPITLTSDKVLYALYDSEVRTYKVTIDPNCEEGENCNIPVIPEKEYNDTVTLPDLSRSYELSFSENGNVENKQEIINASASFLGYCTSREGCTEYIKGSVKVTGDVRYYAMWDERGLTISYTENVNGYKLTDGEGYSDTEYDAEFDKWTLTDNKDAEKVTSVKLISNKTLYAQYTTTKKKYTVTVDTNCADGETCELINPKEVEYNDYYELPSLTRAYELSFEENTNVEEKQKSIFASSTLLGYRKVCNECSNEIVAQAGDKVQITGTTRYQAVWDKDLITVDVPQKGNDYSVVGDYGSFLKWTSEKEETSPEVSGTIELKENKTIYAQYGHAKVTVDVKNEGLDKNGKIEYDQKLTYIITLSNTGNGKATVFIKDNNLAAAIADGLIVLSDDNDSSAISIVEGGLELTINGGTDEEIIELSFIIKANAGEKITNNLEYSINGKNQNPISNTINIEKTISFVGKSERLVGSNVVIVVDKSASMDDKNKMVNAKLAAQSFIDSIFVDENTDTAGTTISVVTFGTKCKYADKICKKYNKDGSCREKDNSYVNKCNDESNHEVLKVTLDTTATDYSSAQQLKSEIGNISDVTEYFGGSGTPYYAGFELANAALDKYTTGNNKNDNQNVVIFLTDGEPTLDNETARQTALDNLESKDAIIYAISFDMDEYKTNYFGDKICARDNGYSWWSSKYECYEYERSEAYNRLKSITAYQKGEGYDDRVITSGVDGLIEVFENLGSKISGEPKSVQTKDGLLSMGKVISVDKKHPIIVVLNGDESTEEKEVADNINEFIVYNRGIKDNNKSFSKYTDAMKEETLYLTYDDENGYDINASKFAAEDKIKVEFYISYSE